MRSAGIAAVTVRRAAHALLTLIVASALVWSMQLLAPGDPAMRVLTSRGVSEPSESQIEAERVALGLDRNPVVRFGTWISDAAQGDLGTSWVTGKHVVDELWTRLPATIVLTITALVFALIGSLCLALIAAARVGRWPDVLAQTFSVMGVVLPSFLLGTLVLQIVVLRWGWFSIIADGSWRAAILPALTLAFGTASLWVRVLRAQLLIAGAATHNDVARARGARPRRRLLVHDLPNAMVPFLTVVGTGTAALLGGAPIVETVFTWPGVGRYVVTAITARDLPVVQGFTLFAITLFVVINMLVDMMLMVLDPRLRGAARSRLTPS